MTTARLGFSYSSRSLLWRLIKAPSQVVSELSQLDASFCFRFAWFCFFVSTAMTAAVQMLVLGLFEDVISDAGSFDQLSKMWGGVLSANMEELKSQFLHLKAVSVLNLALAPLSAWFFPYLLSGAIYVLMGMLAAGKNAIGLYDTVVKLVCVSFGFFLFCAIPLVGPLIGNVWWFIFLVRSSGSIFPVSFFGRLSATLLSSIILFSIWNSTVARLANALL